jgi:hypothetical protein
MTLTEKKNNNIALLNGKNDPGTGTKRAIRSLVLSTFSKPPLPHA